MAYYKNIFKITPNNLLPAQGNILISEPFLQDFCFQRSVILLVEHDSDGSMGFVLNKKTEYIVNTFFPDLEALPEIPIYLGGPVSPNRLFFIHTLESVTTPETIRINDHLFFDGDFDALKAYIQAGHPIEGKVKFFIGYSGWLKGQLGQEIKNDSWVVYHASNESVLNADGESFWKSSVESLGCEYTAWTNFPKDPHMN